MRHLPIKTISLLSALGLAVGTAVAQQGAPSADELLTEYDQDSNMSLSEQEFEQLYEERMQASSGQGATQVPPGQQGATPPSPQGQQGGQGQAGGQANIPQGGGAGTAGQVFESLDSDGNMELSTEELALVVPMLQSGGQQASTGQPGAANPQVGATSPSSQSSQSSTVFAGEVNTSPEIGTEQPSQTDPRLTAQAGGAQQDQTSPGAQGQLTQQGQQGQQQAQQAQQQAQQAEQQAQRADQQAQQAQQQAGAGGQVGQAGQSTLEQMASSQPDQLRGMAVRSSQGEEIGEIDEVVRDRSNGDLYAVISSGGILGIGADKSAVRLSELQMENDAIVYGSSPDQLEQQPYEESRFEPVQSAEEQASATEPGAEQPA